MAELAANPWVINTVCGLLVNGLMSLRLSPPRQADSDRTTIQNVISCHPDIIATLKTLTETLTGLENSDSKGIVNE